MIPDLDAWIARPAVRTRHRREADAAPSALWRAAEAVRLDDTRTLGHLVRWRIHGLRTRLTFRELFSEPPFVVLDAGEHHLVSGFCGRIWGPVRNLQAPDDADAFAAWRAPNTVRIVFAHWVEASAPGRAAIVSEARVDPVDRIAAVRLRALWALLGVFERFIGDEPLALAVHRAEREHKT